MNRILAQLSLFILVLSFGCTIQKRQFRSGWHIPTKKAYSFTQEKEKSNEHIQLSSKIKEREDVTKNNRERSPEKRENPTKYKTDKQTAINHQVKSKNKNLRIQERSGHSIYQQEAITFQNQQSKNHTKKRVQDNLEPESGDSEEHWFPRFIGGFLGVLLGLIAFIPLFFIVCFFFLVDGKVSDLTFEENDSDSPFIRSFKNTYHAVFRVGLLFTIIFLIFGVAALIIFIAYAALQVVGIILGSLIALLILFLFIKIWRDLLDALMFDK